MTALIEAAAAKDYPAEIAVVVSNRPDAPGLARARAAGIATAIVDHAQFGADREAFERALDEELRNAADRSCLPRRIHAAFDAVVCNALERPDAQHPSVAAAAIQGASHPPPGARSRRETARRDRALRRAGDGCGADRGAGFRRGARRRHRTNARRARAGNRARDLSPRVTRGGGGPDKVPALDSGKANARAAHKKARSERPGLCGPGRPRDPLKRP